MSRPGREKNMDKTARYVRALKRIGGAAVLMNLPEPIKMALKETTDLTAKAKMLEAIAEELEGVRHGSCS